MKLVKRLACLGVSLLVIGIISCIILIATVGINNKNGIFYKHNNIDNRVIDSNINKIDINLNFGKIEIVNSEDNKLSYEYYGLGINENINSNSLVINENNYNLEFNLIPMFIFGDNTSNLKLRVPNKDIILNIKSNASDIRINNIKINSLNVNSSVGNIIIKNSNINNKLDVNSNIGNIELGNIKDVKYLNTSNNIGNIELKEIYPNEVMASNNIGNIEYYNSDKNHHFDIFNIDVDLGSKKVEV